MGYSFRLAARVLLYASSRQDNTYHGLCYTSRGALGGTRNSSMGPPHEGSIRRPIESWANALTTELHLAETMLHLIWYYQAPFPQEMCPSRSHKTHFIWTYISPRCLSSIRALLTYVIKLISDVDCLYYPGTYYQLRCSGLLCTVHLMCQIFILPVTSVI